MNAERPRVSVILPAYNAAGSIAATLAAVAAQTLPPHEVIVVDDGSSDGTAAAAIACQGICPSLKVISQPNGGTSVARNTGLDAASGDWILFCDADDRPQPELVAYLVARAAATETDLAVCALRKGRALEETAYVFPCEGETIVSARPLFRALLSHRDTRVHGYLVTSLLRRSVIERAPRLRFVVGMRFQQDELFYLAYLLRIDRAALSDRVLYDYLYCPTSSTARHFRKAQPKGFMHTMWALRDWERFRLSCRACRPSVGLLLAACWHSLRADRKERPS